MTQHLPRHMLLVAFMQAANCSNYPASWRHAATEMRFLTPDYYQHIARTLEAGKFHLAFVDDRLAMPSQYGESFAEAVQHGIRVVKLDLIPVVTAMALATRYLGVGRDAFHHLLRAVSYCPAVFHPRSLLQWPRCLECGDVTQRCRSAKLWRSTNMWRTMHATIRPMSSCRSCMDCGIPGRQKHWCWTARRARLLIRPGCIDSTIKGAGGRRRALLTVPRSPQGYPVVTQAGQSSRGREFAGTLGRSAFFLTCPDL